MKNNIGIGQKFGQRTIISFSHKNDHCQYFWNCRCDCGVETVVEQSRLKNGHANACATCANFLRRKHAYFSIGDKVGKWLVLREDEFNKNFIHARCDCGVVKRLYKRSLVYENSSQCKKCGGKQASPGTHGHNSKGNTSGEYRAWSNAKSRVSNKNITNYKNYGGRGITMAKIWFDSFEAFLNDVGLKPTSKHSLERINNDGNYEPGNVRWALPDEQNKNRSITFKVNEQYINTKELAKELKLHVRTIKHLLLEANFTLEEIHEFAGLSHYQKIEMGKSINRAKPLTLEELKKLKSPVLPSPKRHPLWSTWHSMKQRCNNPKNKDYHNYGAKGIEVTDDWATFKEFLISILNGIGDRPSSAHQLDRINNTKHYTIENVRWATRQEQARNKERTIYLNGIGISSQEIGSKYNIYNRAVINLVKLGWNEEGIAFLLL